MSIGFKDFKITADLAYRIKARLGEESEMSDEKIMYAASLVQEELIIREVGEGVYRRIGTQGLSNTKLEAAEVLKRNLMEKFQRDMKCVDWQAQQFIKSM